MDQSRDEKNYAICPMCNREFCTENDEKMCCECGSRDAISKITLCVLPTQFGKTYTTINKIDDEISIDDKRGESVHLIFTANTLFNNEQFANRLETIEKKYGVGSVCVFSSKKYEKYKHVKDLGNLQGLFFDKKTCPRVVVMCSNDKRIDDVVRFLQVIDENVRCNSGNISRVFVYFDELHEYISTMRKKIEIIHGLDVVKNITGFTATPDNIFGPKIWSKIGIIKLDKFCDTDYVGCNDMEFECIDDFHFRTKMGAQIYCFVEFVLNKFPEILKDRTRTFIPGHISRVSHDRIRDLVFERNPRVVVVTINGIKKELEYKDFSGYTKIPLTSKDEELCETIARLVRGFNLENRPIVITGFLCVSMGQTLTHKSLGSFTSAIFGQVDLTSDQIYQLFGRTTGRMKNWGEKYVKTKIYCPTIIKDRCCIMEHCATSVAIDRSGTEITQQDYREPITRLGEIGKTVLQNFGDAKPKRRVKTKDTDKYHMVLENQEEAIEFAEKFLRVKFDKRSSSIAPETLRKNGKNLSVTELLDRFWGINSETPARMVPTDTGEWCVYWRQTLILEKE